MSTYQPQFIYKTNYCYSLIEIFTGADVLLLRLAQFARRSVKSLPVRDQVLKL